MVTYTRNGAKATSASDSNGRRATRQRLPPKQMPTKITHDTLGSKSKRAKLGGGNKEGPRDNTSHGVVLPHTQTATDSMNYTATSNHKIFNNTLAFQDQLVAAQKEIIRLIALNFDLLERLSASEGQKRLLEKHRTADAADPEGLRRSISYLQDRLGAENTLHRRRKDLRADRLGLPISSIIKEFRILCLDIGDVCAALCNNLCPNNELPPEQSISQSSLQEWALKLSDCTMEQLLVHCKAKNIDAVDLLPSLIITGLFQLIFEPVFPEFIAMDSPLLKHYRKLILVKDGQQALEEWDLLALASLFEAENVEPENGLGDETILKTKIIPEQANYWSKFIIHVIKPFLPLENQDMCKRTSMTKKEDIVLNGFVNTISNAISLKANMSLSKGSFRYRYFKPGTLYDDMTMEPWPNSALDPKAAELNSTTLSTMVALCLQPALYYVPEDKMTKDEFSPSLDSTIGCCRNVTEATSFDRLKLLSKAVVI